VVADPSFTDVYVKAWGSLPVTARLEAGQVAKWEWRTQAHDIQFSATFQPDAADDGAAAAKGKKAKPPAAIIVHASSRVAHADQILQHGQFAADAQTGSGVLTLHWDNSYSKLRGKNLSYKLVVLSAASASASALPLGALRMTPFGPGTIEGLREEEGIYVVGLVGGTTAYLNAETILAAPLVPGKQERTTNERCNVGVDLFFNNRVWDAEAFFKREVDRHPQFSLAYGSLGFLRALMTWQKADIAEANHRLKHTRSFVSALLPQESTLVSMGRFLSGRNGGALTPQQLEHTLLQAEAYLLQAMLLFTEESMVSYVKAGLRIRAAWKLYQRCQEVIASWDAPTRAALDPSVAGGIQFGIGTFNVVISTLPPLLLRVVSALGFPSDRKTGLELLESCSQTPGIRQSLSSLMLLFVHVIIPSFFTVRPGYHAAAAERILADAFARYPRGALFLWMQGRLLRSKRDLPGAIAAFQASARGQPAWLQLQHLCAYELGFCHFFSLQYARSAECWDVLVRENSWSKAFFTYMRAVCLLSAAEQQRGAAAAAGASAAAASSAQSAEALRLFAQVDPSITRKFGGKVIAIEQFVSRRAAQFLATGGGADVDAAARPPVLPAVELIYLFYGFSQMPDELLLECLNQCDAVLGGAAAAAGDLDAEERALALLLKASALKGLRRWNFAKLLLLQLVHGPDSHAELDTLSYVRPFARFELASLLMEQVQEKDEALKAATAAGAPRPQLCSLDEPMPADAGPGTAPGAWLTTSCAQQLAQMHPLASASSASASPAAAWEAQRSSLLDVAWQCLKKAESARASYLFANRLHLRIHLACVEVKLMRRHWRDIQGNVQDEDAGDVAAAAMGDDPAAAAAGQTVDGSDDEAE